MYTYTDNGQKVFELGWFRDYNYKPKSMTDEKFNQIRKENDGKIMLKFLITRKEATKLQNEACAIADVNYS